MAVYTDLSDDDLRDLLAAYDLGEATALKGIAEGVENSNFLLETERGRFILTIYEKRVAPADLPFFMAVTEALADRGFPAPRPMRRRDGATLSTVCGKSAAIIAFLRGVSPRRPSAAQCRAVGETLAHMHAALADFSAGRANALSLTAWARLVSPRLDDAEAMRPGLRAAVSADLDALQQAWPETLPRGVIHADLFPDNALFLGDALSGVIDFYFACTDAFAYDLAVCLNAWCFDGRDYNITRGAHLIAGYQSVRPLSPDEVAALPILSRGAAMRFFATRLADWSAAPPGALVRPKDPMEYADKLDFHRKAKGAADYGA
ncbi:MAG: homoserine kinase [Alphaproteobacteria bacterium]|nr:homoserine kinase [Alphaproteobacteria bacterium]